jgi:hypothetical protein
MDLPNIRMECLKLARSCDTQTDSDGAAIIARARTFYNFVMDQSDPQPTGTQEPLKVAA